MKMRSLIVVFFIFFSALKASPEDHRHNKNALSKYSCVVVYQFGKVGSVSLQHFFKPYLPSIHSHVPKPIRKLLNGDGEQKFLVVNAMRNVFDRNVSCLSQRIKRGRVKVPKNYVIDDLLRVFPNICSVENDVLQSWYGNFNQLLGLHTFDQPFDLENKFYFESTEKCDVLVLRFEDIAEWPVIIGKALDLKNVQLPRENIESIRLYNEFKKVVRYPQSEIEHVLSFDYMRHFYTQEELDSLVDKYLP